MIEATFEHFALNVRDKAETVAWYEAHMGLKIVRDVPGSMAFLADHGGTVVLEVYENQNAPALDFAQCHPLTLHIAFEVDDPAAAAERLAAAGATVVDTLKQAGDDSLIMLRDPFGLALQLVKRGTPMQRR